MSHEIPAPQQMFKMITGYWVSQAIGTFAELGLADELAKGPRTATRLARDVGAKSRRPFVYCAPSPRSACSSTARATSSR